IISGTMTHVSDDTGAWLELSSGAFRLAIALVPFAGLFFLWFIAVARERLGRFEDQFFSTVFIGSGLLFLAMVFAAAATAGAIVAAAANDPSGFAASSTYAYARQAVTQILAVYALRVAAIFQLSQASLWVRTREMPRWMALITVVVALVLLFVFTQSFWVVLAFPAWVLLVSFYILVGAIRGRPTTEDEADGSSRA
ncbi:MAG: hypothetical protein WCN81_10955, partial [Actinomycetes bacterium]